MLDDNSDDMFTLPEGLSVRDEVRYQEEVTHLAGRIIADDKPEDEFDRILRASGSEHYAIELAGDAVMWVTRMALSDETAISIIPVYAGRIDKFIVLAKRKIALWL